MAHWEILEFVIGRGGAPGVTLMCRQVWEPLVETEDRGPGKRGEVEGLLPFLFDLFPPEIRGPGMLGLR